MTALAALSWAQNSTSASPSGGWRRFDDGRSLDVSAQQQQLPAPGSNAGQGYPGMVTIPAGTFLTVRVNEPLSSDHSQAGDLFTATLSQPLVAGGLVIARRGQTLAGTVTQAEKAGRVKGTSKLAIELTELTVADGNQVPMHSQLAQFSGNTSQGRDAAAIGTTTGVGAAIGAAAAGGFGAGMGAIAGAGASIIGVLATRGQPTVIYPEAQVTFRLTDPVTVDVERSAQAFQPAQQQDYDREPSPRQGAGGRPLPPPPPYYGRGYYGPYYGPGYYGPGFYGPSVFYGGVYIRRGGRRW
jgi:hypothetical protein